MIRFIFVRLTAPLFGRCPRLSYRVATPAGWAAWKILKSMRRNVICNQLPLCGDDSARARRQSLRAVRNLAHYWVDLSTMLYRDVSRFESKHLQIVNGERLEVLNDSRAVLIVSAHTGNPELCIQALIGRGRNFLALVQKLEPPALNRYMLRMRSSGGGRFLEADFRGARAALRTLREGGLVGVLADRDLQGTGLCVNLFGQDTRLPRGPWELARRSGATVLPVFARRERFDDHTVVIHEPFYVPATGDAEGDIAQAVNKFAILLEGHLRDDPGQWGVLEDFWRVHRCG